MLRGEKVGLRARHETDVSVLETELYDDVATQVRASGHPWRPVPPGSPASLFLPSEPEDRSIRFSVVRLTDNELAGDASLWGVDQHNRVAHLGMSLRPSFRGRGLGTDVVRVLCHYGFTVRGLHRLQLETLADNAAMIKAATRVGFTHEGTLRRSSWTMGSFQDDVIFGLLATEWVAG